MNFERILNGLKRILPSPFSIALILTLVSYFLAVLLLDGESVMSRVAEVSLYWNKGFWELLAFAMQMMIMLVLGHTLAISPAVSKFIDKLISGINFNSKAVVVTAVFTMIMAYLNWALALIFGAVIARKIAEKSLQNNFKINYPLVAAAAYSGLLVWHGGLSGSAPLKVAEQNHFLYEKIGVIPVEQTIFSTMNIVSAIAIIAFISLGLYFLSLKTKTHIVDNELVIDESDFFKKSNLRKHFSIDNSALFVKIVVFFMFVSIVTVITKSKSLNFININFINFVLFALALLYHKNVKNFLSAVNKAIVGASGILIQFPLYAGIMGIMKYSGLSEVFTNFFIEISNQTTLPVFTFISAGIVNVFVPSGGGQWAVQGPVIVDAALKLHVPVNKVIMALAYGDELTNMIQPFWALPLLGITGLKAKDIFPYTLFMMLIGTVVYISCLLIF